jgi:hypothetical protein
MSVDRGQWARDHRFKNLAHVLWKELQASPGNEEAILTQRLYDVIVTLTLPAVSERFHTVLQEQLMQGWDIYVDVPDLSKWPDHHNS